MSALFVACGDDEDGGGNAGTGGTAGSGGSAGTGGAAGTSGTGGTAGTGTGGSAGSGGTAGTAGTAGTGGTSGDPDAGGPCTGCLEVRVTVTDENQLAPFNIDLGETNLVDFSAGSLTFHIRAEAFGDSVGVVPFVNDANFTGSFGTFLSLNSANDFGTNDFVPVTLDLAGIGLPPNVTDAGVDAGPDPDGFDKREVRVIGLQVGTGAGYVSSTADAGADGGAGDDIVIFIDRITFSGVDGELADFEFSDNAQNFVLNTFFGHQDAVVIHH